MRARLLVVVAVLAVAACARATLPYTPERQPPGAHVSAGYMIVGDRLRVEIDTDHRLLEQAWIIKPDGSAVAVQAVESAPRTAGPSSSISIGVGGATWGGHGGVGSGASVGIPVGGGGTHVAGNTVAWFPLAAAGPAPWRLYVKIADAEPTTILLGGPPPAR